MASWDRSVIVSWTIGRLLYNVHQLDLSGKDTAKESGEKERQGIQDGSEKEKQTVSACDRA